MMEVTSQQVKGSPRWCTLGYPVMVCQETLAGVRRWILAVKRRDVEAKVKLVRSTCAAFSKHFKGNFSTEADARTRMRRFRHWVNYLMDSRLTLGSQPSAFGASPAPTPEGTPAKRGPGRPPKKQRTERTPAQTPPERGT